MYISDLRKYNKQTNTYHSLSKYLHLVNIKISDNPISITDMQFHRTTYHKHTIMSGSHVLCSLTYNRTPELV